MITSVEFENFRCLRKATLRLGPLTALVGPNAAGKSSALHGLAYRDIRSEKNVWRFDQKLKAQITFVDGSSRTGVAFGKYTNHSFGPISIGIAQPQFDYGLHQFSFDAMRQNELVSDSPRLTFNGNNIVNVIASIPRGEQEALSKQFCALVPVFADLHLRPHHDGYQKLLFEDRWNRDLLYEAAQVSDGSLLVLALITLQYQRRVPSIVLLDEPERGLHPYLVNEMVTLLRAMSSGSLGKPATQVVLATQSPVLLGCLSPEEVRFLDRNQEDGSVIIREAPTDSDLWEKAYAAYEKDLGSLWLSGGLGAVPAV